MAAEKGWNEEETSLADSITNDSGKTHTGKMG
jgi:hypothetical protein